VPSGDEDDEHMPEENLDELDTAARRLEVEARRQYREELEDAKLATEFGTTGRFNRTGEKVIFCNK
jgi:hypothetical protein